MGYGETKNLESAEPLPGFSIASSVWAPSVVFSYWGGVEYSAKDRAPR